MAWIGLTIIDFLARWYFAAGYLWLMPATSLVISYTHGGKPRQLLGKRTSPFNRLVVVTSSLNGSEWFAFMGNSHLLNSLLNKPLYRTCHTPLPTTLRLLTQLLVLAQRILAIASCAMQNWNALAISTWILFCAGVSAYGYSAESSAKDWLTHTCSVNIERTSTDFGSRRAMLTALLYLNPDTCEDRTNWINPILANSSDRSSWEAAALAIIKTGSSNNESRGDEYWWKYIDEGTGLGREIEKEVIQRVLTKDMV